MRPAAKPGFWLVAKREWQWLLHDPVALILIFGVPLFAFVVLSLAFSHPVIRGLGVVEKSSGSAFLTNSARAAAIFLAVSRSTVWRFLLPRIRGMESPAIQIFRTKPH
jgi:ABC-2 type transport system permease protein